MTPIIVALDYSSMSQALEMAARLDPKKCRVKVGKELFTACGPSIVEALQLKGFDVFLDLKFHDIPNTVAEACRSAVKLGVWMVNMHISSGRSAIESAVSLVKDSSEKTLLIGMTVLSSLTAKDLQEVGINCKSVDDLVMHQAILAEALGMDGIVCSALDLNALKNKVSERFIKVVPGVRPGFFSQEDDQKRIATPKEALENGATYIVIGRPITKHESPETAFDLISKEILS